jgi:hypothetical protein
MGRFWKFVERRGKKSILPGAGFFLKREKKSGNILRMYEESGDVSKGFQMISIYYKEKENI